MRAEGRGSLWKGLLAGALGGFVGSFAMSQFHSLVVPQIQTSSQPDEDDSTVLAGSAISEALFHHELTEQERKMIGPIVHYAFGASMGSVYAALMERAPSARAGWGVPFALVLWMGAHVITVPALGFSEPITRSTLAAEGAEFGAHLVYGAATEAIRRFARLYLLP
jgi:putative membrane protein